MKRKKYLLSICIPVFNRYKLFKRLLNSIKSKNYKFLEIVIVNDGSNDNIESLVNKINQKFETKYLFQKNKGVAHAMLAAYKMATGTYCIKMDTDDTFLPNGIDNILKILNNNKKVINENKKLCGIVFGTKLVWKNKTIINRLPDNIITNFLALRADLQNLYDCKEVVKRSVILQKQIPISSSNKVIQQSWFNIANYYDCLTSDSVVARKEYLDDGLSSNSAIKYKVKESKILAEMNFKIAKSKKYKSKIFRFRTKILAKKYAMHSNQKLIKNFSDVFFTILAWPLYKYEKLFFDYLKYSK